MTEQEKDFEILFCQEDIERIAENSFWILHHIMVVHNHREILRSGLPGLYKCLEVFERKVKLECPKIYSHLKKYNVTPD